MEINHLKSRNDNALVMVGEFSWGEKENWNSIFSMRMTISKYNVENAKCDLSAEEGDAQTDINVHWRQGRECGFEDKVNIENKANEMSHLD